MRAAAVVVLVAAGSLAALVSRVSAVSVSCDPSALVSALSAVSGSGQSGTVTLSAGCTYTMTSVNNSIDGNNAFPDVLGNVTVVGNGATITRSSSASQPFRFWIVDDGGTLNLSNLTLSGGTVPASDTHGGGALFNRSSLNVTNVTFANNQSLAAAGGGAIDNHDLGVLNVSLSTFTNNVGLQGGAIENEATYCHSSTPLCASVTVTDSTFTGNTTTQYGGGGYEGQHNESGYPTCGPTWPQSTRCQIPGGTRNTLTRDTFAGNGAMTEGGAVANFGTTTISNSTIANNRIIGTSSIGDGGGGGVQTTGTMTISSTTLSGNSSGTGANIHTYTDTANQPGPPVTQVSTTIVASPAGGGSSCSGSAALTDTGYNLDSGSSCGFSSSKGSRSSTSPQLSALASNGGPTQTMAPASTSPAVDAVPTSFSGCTGTDQRGVARPQGPACDVGAYERQGSSPSPSPSVSPSSSASPSSSPSPSPSLSPSPSTSPSLSPSPSSSPSPSLSPSPSTSPSPSPSPSLSPSPSPSPSPSLSPSPSTSPSPSGNPSRIVWNQGDARVTGGRVASLALTLSRPVAAGDLLVGWFGQYDAAGQVSVSDPVNGAWTRAPASLTFSNGHGDIALFYVQNAAAAPSGLTITLSGSAPTYLQGAAADYSGVATTNAFDTATTRSGKSSTVTGSATGPATAGELVVGGIMTGGSPSSITAGTSAGQPFTLRSHTSSGTVDIEDIASTAAGTQATAATFGASTDWYCATALFRGA